jgi:ankyrin repeat protein
MKSYNNHKDYNSISNIDKNTLNLILNNALNSRNNIFAKFLIENGADIHTNNDEALRNASKVANLEMVKFLIENKANIHANNDEALRNASKIGNLETVVFLIENGAYINANNGETFKNALKNGNLEIVKFLIENGADFNPNNKDLLNSLQEDNLEILKYLFEKGININVNNDEYLRNACKNGNLEMVKFLIENGADIHTNNDEALRNAFKNENLIIVKFLIENGAYSFLLDDNKEISYNQIVISPDKYATETVIFENNFIDDSANNFFEKNKEGINEPIDPINFEPIPFYLCVLVHPIKNPKIKRYFNSMILYKYWKIQSKNIDNINLQYAGNPLNRGYFNEISVDYVINKLKVLNLI